MNSAILKSEQGHTSVDIALIGDFLTWNVLGLYAVAFQTVNRTQITWGTGVITVEFSNDGETWNNLPAGTETYSAAGLQRAIVLGGVVKKMRARVTTANATAADVHLYVVGVTNT